MCQSNCTLGLVNVLSSRSARAKCFNFALSQEIFVGFGESNHPLLHREYSLGHRVR